MQVSVGDSCVLLAAVRLVPREIGLMESCDRVLEESVHVDVHLETHRVTNCGQCEQLSII